MPASTINAVSRKLPRTVTLHDQPRHHPQHIRNAGNTAKVRCHPCLEGNPSTFIDVLPPIPEQTVDEMKALTTIQLDVSEIDEAWGMPLLPTWPAYDDYRGQMKYFCIDYSGDLESITASSTITRRQVKMALKSYHYVFKHLGGSRMLPRKHGVEALSTSPVFAPQPTQSTDVEQEYQPTELETAQDSLTFHHGGISETLRRLDEQNTYSPQLSLGQPPIITTGSAGTGSRTRLALLPWQTHRRGAIYGAIIEGWKSCTRIYGRLQLPTSS
jgi:hypothetical protein